MVDIKSLRPGDKVKVVDAWVADCHQNSGGGMDQYLGKVVTVRSAAEPTGTGWAAVRIEEDQDDAGAKQCGQIGWYWSAAALEYIEEAEEELEPPSEEEFLASLRLLGLQ